MHISINAVRPYGFGLPNETQRATILNVAGLDTLLHGWRIRHPHAVMTEGKFGKRP